MTFNIEHYPTLSRDQLIHYITGSNPVYLRRDGWAFLNFRPDLGFARIYSVEEIEDIIAAEVADGELREVRCGGRACYAREDVKRWALKAGIFEKVDLHECDRNCLRSMVEIVSEAHPLLRPRTIFKMPEISRFVAKLNISESTFCKLANDVMRLRDPNRKRGAPNNGTQEVPHVEGLFGLAHARIHAQITI